MLIHKLKFVVVAGALCTLFSCEDPGAIDGPDAPLVAEPVADEGLNDSLAMAEIESFISAAAVYKHSTYRN